MLEAQLNYSLEAHKCELGTLTRGALVTIGSGPNMSRVHMGKGLGTARERRLQYGDTVMQATGVMRRLRRGGLVMFS